MRGSPLFRASLVLFALLLLMLPLHRLTSGRRNVATVMASPIAPSAIVHLTITSTSVPFRFEISHLGKTIWKGESNESSSSRNLTMHFPPEGIDLGVRASWPNAGDTALRIEVARGGDAPIVKTLWGIGHVDDVVTFSSYPP
jgi:hypothetical protein